MTPGFGGRGPDVAASRLAAGARAPGGKPDPAAPAASDPRSSAERALQEKNLELEVLSAVSIAASSSLELPVLLERALDAVLHVTGLAPVGGIFLADEELSELTLAVHRGLPPQFVELEQKVRVGECLCGHAAQTAELVTSHDSSVDERHTRAWGTERHSHVIVPLIAHERVRGVMFLYPAPDYVVDDFARRLFGTIGRQIGVAIEHALVFRATDAELRHKIMELGATLQELERQKAKTNEIQRWKDDWVAMICHDLRAPLSGMLAQADLLRRRSVRNEAPWALEIAEAIIRGGQNMNGLIHDLAETARLEAGQVKLDFERVAPALVVSDVLEALGDESRARIRIDDPGNLPDVLADRARVGRAVTNLVTNALKYSPEDSEVWVRLSAHAGEVTISVEDMGIGIDIEALPHVFDRFFRVNRETGPAGFGLGLYIARLLVEAHRGRISVTSIKGERSTFRIALASVSPVAG